MANYLQKRMSPYMRWGRRGELRAIHIFQTIGVETIRGNEMADYDIKLNTNHSAL